MFTKTALTALTAAATLVPNAASALSVYVPAVPSQSFLYSEVVSQADVSTPDFVRTSVALGEDGHATDSTNNNLGSFAGAIANIQSRFVGDLLLMSGTSHGLTVGSSAEPAFYHEVRTTIDATTTTIFSLLVSPEVTDAAFDRELMSSLEITDGGGNVVDISAQLAALNADPNARLLEIELGPGAYSTYLGTGSGARADDEFQLRSTVVAAPTPSAALAGLVGLGALTRRRRKQA